MGARTKARKRALDILYEAEARGLAPADTLGERVAVGDPPVNPYTVRLVQGVTEHREEIDRLLGEHAAGWTLERMPAVDRNLLRLGLFELLYVDDVPDPVVLDEAVRLAGELSTEESPRFVNGLLASIRRTRPAAPATDS